MILGGNKMFGNILNYILGLGAAIFLPNNNDNNRINNKNEI